MHSAHARVTCILLKSPEKNGSLNVPTAIVATTYNITIYGYFSYRAFI